MASTKDVLRSLIPPILWPVAHRLKSYLGVLKPAGYEGPFASWEAALSRSDGWEVPAVTDKTLGVALQVRDGLLEFELDTVARTKIIYSAPILAFLLLVLSRHKNVLNFIDFGGGLGTNYFQNRKILRQLAATSVRWNIVERPTLAKLGTEHFQTGELRFYPALEDALSKIEPIPDALLFSGSLQYIADPFSLLDQVIDAGITVIAFDRLPVSQENENAIFVQHLLPNVYGGASLPCWRFLKDDLVAWFGAKGFTLVELFAPDSDAPFYHCGLIFVSQH